jgi:hypothetical protein
MATKAKPKTSTARIRYSRAITLASEYLGDPEFVERDILTGLAAGDIPWWCERFEAPQGYSGPGRGDPKFWETDHLCTRDGILTLRGLHTKGDSAKRRDGVAAFGIDLGRSALVRRKLLPPSDFAGDRSSGRNNRKQPQMDRIRQALQELYPYPDGIDGFTDAAVRKKVGDYLQPEIKNGLKVPDRRSMNRALRQYRNRNR